MNEVIFSSKENKKGNPWNREGLLKDMDLPLLTKFP
jgi:hypothetical protein